MIITFSAFNNSWFETVTMYLMIIKQYEFVNLHIMKIRDSGTVVLKPEPTKEISLTQHTNGKSPPQALRGPLTSTPSHIPAIVAREKRKKQAPPRQKVRQQVYS